MNVFDSLGIRCILFCQKARGGGLGHEFNFTQCISCVYYKKYI